MSDLPDLPETPKDRDTDPDIRLSDRALLLLLKSQVDEMAKDLALVRAETTGISKAFHDVNSHLAVIKADLELATEQIVPIGTALGDLQARLFRAERIARKLPEGEG